MTLSATLRFRRSTKKQSNQKQKPHLTCRCQQSFALIRNQAAWESDGLRRKFGNLKPPAPQHWLPNHVCNKHKNRTSIQIDIWLKRGAVSGDFHLDPFAFQSSFFSRNPTPPWSFHPSWPSVPHDTATSFWPARDPWQLWHTEESRRTLCHVQAVTSPAYMSVRARARPLKLAWL